MSWKTAGKLVSGPPTASGSGSGSASKYRQNTGGLNAFQREQQFAAHYSRKDREVQEFGKEGKTDWDVLKENHRFIRDDEDVGDVSWEERLARAYESKLFKEFALVSDRSVLFRGCVLRDAGTMYRMIEYADVSKEQLHMLTSQIDLKHYKSRRLALRWRTAEEVVEGLGEDTCGSLRCKYHQTPTSDSRDHARVRVQGEKENERERKRAKKIPALRAFELPFVYLEAGERKEALVKVRLCGRCEGKLTWKPDRDRPTKGVRGDEVDSDEDSEDDSRAGERGGGRKNGHGDHDRSSRDTDRKDDRRRHRSRSRSKSPKVETRPRSRSRSPRRNRDRNLI